MRRVRFASTANLTWEECACETIIVSRDGYTSEIVPYASTVAGSYSWHFCQKVAITMWTEHVKLPSLEEIFASEDNRPFTGYKQQATLAEQDAKVLAFIQTGKAPTVRRQSKEKVLCRTVDGHPFTNWADVDKFIKLNPTTSIILGGRVVYPMPPLDNRTRKSREPWLYAKGSYK